MSVPSIPPGQTDDLTRLAHEASLWAIAADATHLDADARAELARSLETWTGIEGCLVLTTCHRVEVYGRGSAPALPGGDRASGPRLLVGRAVVRHLLRVAAGLESAVVGEDQILSQLRSAARTLLEGAEPDPVLDRLAQAALHLGRHVRRAGRPRERGLAERALGWLGRRTENPAHPRLLVAGAGPMGRTVAYAARRRGAQVSVATRSPRRLFDGLEAVDLRAGAALAPAVDGIVVALAGRWEALVSLDPGNLPPTVDLSAPGAIPPAVRAGLRRGFIDIDGLFEGPVAPPEGAVGAFTARAAAEVDLAERAFLTWLAARPAGASARSLVDRAARRRDRRVERTLRRLPELDERGRELVRQLAAQLAADILHEPLSHLRSDADGTARVAARELFDL